MPDRLVRDELLTSERYWAVSANARCLFLALILSADDTGRYTGSSFALAHIMAHTVDAQTVDNLLTELTTVDLIRPYTVDAARFIFIPRFRQRLRYQHSRFPTPPNEINVLTEKKTDSSPTQARLKPDPSQTQVSLKSAEVKRSEVKRSEVYNGTTESTSPARATPNPQVFQNLKAILEKNVFKPNPNPTPPTQTDTLDSIDQGEPDAATLQHRTAERVRQLRLAQAANVGQTPEPGKPTTPTRKTNGFHNPLPDWARTDQGITHRASALGIQPQSGDSYATLRDRCIAVEQAASKRQRDGRATLGQPRSDPL